MAGLCAEIASHTLTIIYLFSGKLGISACVLCVYRMNESNGILLRNCAVLVLSFVHRSCYSVRDK